MSYTKGTSGLLLPQKTGKMSKNREISVAAIEKWRNQLPLSDLTASTKALYLTLHDTHQASLPPKVRSEILSILQPTLSYLCQTMEKFYSSQEILNEDQRAIADLVYALRFEMLNGFKLIIDNCLNDFFINKTLLLFALKNAMLFCEKILTHAYEQHRQPPPGIWLELHSLYLITSERNLNTKKLPISSEWNNRLNTIQDIYNHCLLFVISNPHRLRKDQIHELKYALDAWSPLLILRKTDKKTTPLFIVDLHSDSPPQYATLYSHYTSDSYSILLNKINNHLVKLLSAKKLPDNKELYKSFSEAELSLPYSFIETLLNSWRYLSERAHQRQDAHDHITVCIGISASHWYINQDQTIKQAEKSHSQNSRMSSEDIDMDNVPIIQTASELQVQHPKYVCELVDESDGGYRLKWLQAIPSHLECGEIISLERDLNDQQQTWAIGSIRWLRHEKDHSIYLGVQILSLRALSVNARLADAQNPNSIPTLLLPQKDEDHQYMTLITPSLPFKTGQEIELTFEGKNYSANLLKSTSLSPLYQQFELEFPYQAITFPPTTTRDEIAINTLNE